jgi:hypothetical protein
MSNSLGTLAGSLILQRALEMTFTKRPLLRNISLGLKDLDTGVAEAAQLNQSVITRIKSSLAVNSFGTGAQNYTTTDVPVSLTLEKEVHVAFTRVEVNSTERNLIDEAAEPIAIAIANSFVDSVAALWIASNFTNSSTVASGWSYANTLLVLRAAANGRGWSDFGRFFCHSTAVSTALLNDSLIVAESNNAQNANAIQRGELPVVSGFALAEYPAIPSTGNMVGFAGTPDSTILAVRPHRDPQTVIPGLNFPGNFGYITEPKSGLTLSVTQWIDASTLAVNSRISWLQGSAVGNANNGQILKTA